MHELAPIGISVYTRKDHLLACLNSLAVARHGKDSIVYVFSDGAACSDDVELVDKVRSLVNNRGADFRKLVLVSRENNYGGVRNALEGQNWLTKKYGKSIFLEDDIVVAPGFLEFINQGLIKYENCPSIFSVHGYSPPVDLEGLSGDSYFMRRYNGWGVGIWERSIDLARTDLEYLNIFQLLRLKRVLDRIGSDVFFMVFQEFNGVLDAQDVRNTVTMNEQGLLGVYPVRSLTQNMGHDGSGFHCGVSDKFWHESLWQKLSGFSLETAPLIPSKMATKKNKKFRDVGWRGEIKRFFRCVQCYAAARFFNR